MQDIHIVCGPPASGKTTYATELANELGAILLDSDQVTERLVKAGLILAGLDENDRDSPVYKAAYRDPVYETLFDLAVSHAARLPVVIAGPFTSESKDSKWSASLKKRFGQKVEIHRMNCSAEERRDRMIARAEPRDLAKLADWNTHLKQSGELWSVYIIRCGDGSLYTGIAKDVESRFFEHESGAPKGAKYTRGKGPLELVYQAEIGNRSEASKEELRIKALSKKQKLALIAKANP